MEGRLEGKPGETREVANCRPLEVHDHRPVGLGRGRVREPEGALFGLPDEAEVGVDVGLEHEVPGELSVEVGSEAHRVGNAGHDRESTRGAEHEEPVARARPDPGGGTSARAAARSRASALVTRSPTSSGAAERTAFESGTPTSNSARSRRRRGFPARAAIRREQSGSPPRIRSTPGRFRASIAVGFGMAPRYRGSRPRNYHDRLRSREPRRTCWELSVGPALVSRVACGAPATGRPRRWPARLALRRRSAAERACIFAPSADPPGAVEPPAMPERPARASL